MSQESNTTSDTNPKPRLQIAHGPQGAPPANPDTPAAPKDSPAANAPAAAGALPRFSFARKKPTEEAPAAPVEKPAPAPAAEPVVSQLKRPPTGARLTPSSETVPTTPDAMPAPLTPVKQGMSASPFAAQTKASRRGHLGLWIALFVLVAIVGGQSYYILMHDESTVAANNQKPPLLINNPPGGKPYAVVNNGAPAPTPAYEFLLTFDPEIASGNEPRLFFDSQTYHIGQVVAPAFGLKWTRIDDQARELEFTDKQGRRYVKKF